MEEQEMTISVDINDNVELEIGGLAIVMTKEKTREFIAMLQDAVDFDFQEALPKLEHMATCAIWTGGSCDCPAKD